jgi:hypothetical protein
MQDVTNFLYSGLAAIARFGKKGGIFKWFTDHFEVKNPDDTNYAKLKIAKGVDNEDAIRVDQLKDFERTAKMGTVKELVFCLNKDGLVNLNLTNGMIKRGSVLDRIRLVVGVGFDGVLNPDFSLTVNDLNNTVLADSSLIGLMFEGIIEIPINYIFAENADIAANLGVTGGTKGDALLVIIYSEPILYDLPANSELLFTPMRKIIHLDFLGTEGEVTILNVNGFPVTCTMDTGNFVFDISNDTGQTHTFTAKGEEFTFIIDGKEYLIIYGTEEGV